MLVSNLFENNPQENGMAVLKQLATAVRDHTDIDLEVGNELLPIKYYQANHLVSRWKALASSRQQNQALASFGDINWINDVLDAVDARMAAGAKVGSVEGGRDVDEGRTQMYSDGDRVKLNSTYANSDNPNEIYTVAQCDQDRKRCWIGDKSGSGWYVTFDQIIPARSRDTEGPGRPYWSRIHDSSLDETSTINGKREDPGDLRWKQTSMSYEAAVNKYGADHVRKEPKNRAGQEVIAVHVPLGEQAVLEGNNDEYNDESGMAYNSLRTIHRATKGLANTIKDGDNLPEWCQEKISLAEDYLVTVWDYLQSEKGVAEGVDRVKNPIAKIDVYQATIDSKEAATKAGVRVSHPRAYRTGSGELAVKMEINRKGNDTPTTPQEKDAILDALQKLGYSVTDIRDSRAWGRGMMLGYCVTVYLNGQEGVAEGETTLTKTGRIHRSTDAYGGSPPEPDPIGDELDISVTRRIDRALGVRFKTKGYQKDTNTVSEAPGDKGSSREHLARLRAEKKEHEQAQRAKQEKMDRNLKNYQAGDVRASDIKVAEASKTRNPTTDFLRKHPVPDSEMVTPVKNKDADASFKNMVGGSSNELTKNLKIKEQESTPGDEHTRRQKLIKYLAKHKGWDHSDLEHATTTELMQYYRECRQGMPVLPTIYNGGLEVDEGWKSNLAGAALIGMGAMGSNAANARDLSHYNTDYLQAAAQGGKSMVSADDAKAELQQRAQGKQQAVPAPDPGTKASAGYSKEYLQSVIDGTHPRPLISKDRAQALLQQYQTNEASYIDEGMAEGNDQETMNRHIAYYNKLGQTPEINMSKDERYKHSAAGTDYAEFLRKNNVAIPAVEVMSTWGAGFLNAFKYGWKAPSREIDQAVMLIKQSKQGMAEARSADDLQNELTRWKKEGPWKKSTTKDPRGKAPNLSDRARRETEKAFPTTKKV